MALSTPHQRLYIRTLLRDRELATRQVTALHRGIFKRADVPCNEGKELDAELCAFTREQASRLIRALKGAEQ